MYRPAKSIVEYCLRVIYRRQECFLSSLMISPQPMLTRRQLSFCSLNDAASAHQSMEEDDAKQSIVDTDANKSQNAKVARQSRRDRKRIFILFSVQATYVSQRPSIAPIELPSVSASGIGFTMVCHWPMTVSTCERFFDCVDGRHRAMSKRRALFPARLFATSFISRATTYAASAVLNIEARRRCAARAEQS